MNYYPLVTIIINNYNNEKFISEAIDSALNQTYQNIEIIVVDDGSTDNSWNVICNYDLKIKAISKKNQGQASAYNIGFELSKGNIICFLDSDDTFLPEKVEKVVDIFNKYSSIKWCFNNLKLVEKSTSEVLGFHRETMSRLCDFRTVIKKGKLPFYPPPSSCLCFKKELLEQILPMPITFINTSADRYVRLLSCYLGIGFFLEDILTIQGIHDHNAATLNVEKKYLLEREIIIAYLTRIKFPELKKITNRLFAKGLVYYWKYSGKRNNTKQYYDEYIKKYFKLASLLEILIIILMVIIYFNPFRKTYKPLSPQKSNNK